MSAIEAETMQLFSLMKEKFQIGSGPKILYHYTNIYGLEGILKNKEFWVSNASFLNDKTEIRYTLALSREILLKLCEERQIDESEYLSFFEVFVKSRLEEISLEYYLLSFCTNPDSNLLWSNYSNNDGYNISFKFPDIGVDYQDETGVYPWSAYVIYDKNEQRKILKEYIERIIEIVDYIGSLETEELEEVIFDRLGVVLGALKLSSLFFKDECFSQEEEFRIAFTKDKDTFCRISNGAFIPYITAGFKKESVTGITIGPKNNMDITMEGLVQFLNLHEYNHITKDAIRKSCIPYRY
ncbi:DUF2971 domain-containing protein [Bacillus subtilis]|uniref:DUF2971 domain-containing protein n=1 Tax=Bacillus subtilis TaxID=1423 RepID=UPI002DB84A7E|nr:DUF2971 domain-containing protein [Bacillus subtilis]MEC3651400.1 DUF2971 domain-containing protein [Bacillus subtilis]